MKAMILAAGRGERMRPLTDTTPKPLLQAGGKPIIQQTIEQLVSAGFKDIIINTAHLGQHIKKTLGNGQSLGASIVYSDEGDSGLETAGGIIQALPLLGGAPFLVINGDIAHDYDLSQLYNKEIEDAHLVLIPNPEHHPEGDFHISDNGLAKVQGLPTLTFSGIGLYHPRLFTDTAPGKKKLAPLLRKAMADNKVTAEQFNGFWMDIGTPERLKELDRHYQQKITKTQTMPYICPICQSPLKQHAPSQGYYCEKKHHFDLAKEGYLNLLPVQHKKAKEPGDSRAMMRARRHFLEAGFYQPMAQAMARMIDQQSVQQTHLKVLDMGCGEGYYSRQIEALCNSQALEIHGIDIAKNAIFAAAKKQQNAQFIVASNKRMPYSDQFFNLIFRVYAPSDEAEVTRILAPKGLLLTVTPGPRHLWQLKEFIYKKVNEHPLESNIPEGFSLVDSQRVQFKIQPSQEQRMALLQMTPFAWRVKGDALHNIQRAQGLEIETDFVLTLVQKQ